MIKFVFLLFCCSSTMNHPHEIAVFKLLFFFFLWGSGRDMGFWDQQVKWIHSAARHELRISGILFKRFGPSLSDILLAKFLHTIVQPVFLNYPRMVVTRCKNWYQILFRLFHRDGIFLFTFSVRNSVDLNYQN